MHPHVTQTSKSLETEPRTGAKFDLPSLFWVCLTLSIALLIPVAVGSGTINPSRVCAVFVISALTLLLGRTLRASLGVHRTADYAAAFEIVAGFGALSILHLVITASLDLTAGSALAVDCAVVGFLFLFFGRRKHLLGRQDPDLSGQDKCPRHLVVFDVGMLLLISIVVTIWAREAVASVREAHATGVLRVWNDFLLQAAEIRYLDAYPAFGRHSMYLADTAQPLYHRASYALSAVYAWITHDPELETSTYFWMPAGIILLGIAAYGLGCALAGRLAGFASVAGLFMLPDASMYGLHNGYFAFHWLIQVAPGSGYALALTLMGVALYVRGVKESRFRFVVAGAGLAIASAVFRVHIAIPAVMTFTVLMLHTWQPRRWWHRIAVVGALIAIGVGGILLAEHVAFAPHFITGQRDGLRYIEAVHAATPIAYEGLYAKWTAGTSDIWKGVLGYALLLVAELGALLPLLAVFVAFQMRASSQAWRIYTIPLLLLVAHCAITFLMPTAGNGDITEWSHRSFVLIYAVLLIFLVAWITSLCEDLTFWSARGGLFKVAAGSLILLAGVTVPWRFGKNIQYGSLRDGPTACATAISVGMFATSDYVREHALPGDRLAMSDGDPMALGVALTGLQAFVSREALYKTVGGDVGKLAESRGHQLSALRDLSTYEQLVAFGRQSHVRWYVLRQGDMPAWPAALLDRSVFVSADMRVFDLQK